MRRSTKALVVVGVVTLMGLAGTVFAYAGGWILPDNRATLAASVAKMPRGVEPSVAKQSGQAVVSWTAQEIVPGSLMDHYVVTAHHVGAPARPDIARTVAASGNPAESVAFAGTELAGGTWNWTITPKFREWIGAAGRRSRNVVFPAVPVARPADPSAPAVVTPIPGPGSKPGASGSPSPATSSSAPAIGPSPANGGTKAPEKRTETPEPVKSADPPPQPVESSSGEVAAPPADR